MASEWFYQTMGEQVGPVSSAELLSLAQRGIVAYDTPVRKGSEGNWVSAARVKGLSFGTSNPLKNPPAAQECADAANRKTLFRDHALEWQQSQCRSPRHDITTMRRCLVYGVLAIIVGIFVTTLGAGLLLSRPHGRPFAGATILVFGLIVLTSGGWLMIGAIVPLVRASLLSKKQVICPTCGARHTIYATVRKYMCTNCYGLLLLGPDDALQPNLSACPYCTQKTAVSPDCSGFLCPNCGLLRSSPKQRTIEIGSQLCPKCKEPIPKGVIFCRKCGFVTRTEFGQLDFPLFLLDDRGVWMMGKIDSDQPAPALAHDFDWEIGKDGTGHLYFAKALLKAVENGAVRKQESTHVGRLGWLLAKVLMSLEEAWYDPVSRPNVEAILPEIDLTYATLLDSWERALKLSQGSKAVSKEISSLLRNAALRDSEKRALELNQGSNETFLSDLIDERHIVARRRLENIVADSLQSLGSIGIWACHLVEQEGNTEAGGVRVKYDNLKSERLRFADWKTARLAREKKGGER